jgi:Ca-activated chloride channel family protein
VPVPVYDDNNRKMGYRRMLSDLDEPALRQIAETTGGKFFRALDTDTIESAFKAIDRAQKIEFQAKSYLISTELFWWAAAPGIAFLFVAAVFARPLRRRRHSHELRLAPPSFPAPRSGRAAGLGAGASAPRRSERPAQNSPRRGRPREACAWPPLKQRSRRQTPARDSGFAPVSH